MHYTSLENIHKVIDALFLNELREEFARIFASGNLHVKNFPLSRQKKVFWLFKKNLRR